MLKFTRKSSYIKLILIISLGLSITACQNNQPLENILSPASITVEIPQNIPPYPQAQLTKVEASNHYKNIKTFWQVNDNVETVKTYYQDQLKQNGWEILTPFNTQSNNNQNNANLLVAQKNNFKLKISILNNAPIQLMMEYAQAGATLVENETITPEIKPSSTPKPSITVTPQVTTTPSQTPEPNQNQNQSQSFTDLSDLPENFQQYITDLNQLGIFSASDLKENNQFQPNQPIKKRDFVRWLVTTNNKIYAEDNTKQIRLDHQFSALAFRDLPPNDPDFKYIQALAETGIIPSPLTEQNNPDLFNPDQTLTRADLILWKVPLDLRQALPKADVKLIESSWGFQDVAQIKPSILNALYADFQNTKHSNIRRLFGYTILFQPQKSVTRAEAVAALWYFGTDNDGISVKDVLTKNNNTP